MHKLDMYEFCAIALSKKGCKIKSVEIGSRAILVNGDLITEVRIYLPGYDLSDIEVLGEDGHFRPCHGYSYEAVGYTITCIADTSEVVSIRFKDENRTVCFDTGLIL